MAEKLFATFTARQGCEAQVDSLLADYADVVRAETGCLIFSASRRRDEPRSYFVYEEYRDSAAFAAHLSAQYGAAFNRALSPLIEEEGSALTLLDAV
jgi:quinol monooxygenase YgiN